jgi:uroporphyrinogen-III decarboxylase
MPDVCPAAPVFRGSRYVWKVTGRTPLDQMYGEDPGYPQAALSLAARHASDWVLLSVTDGDGRLRGKGVRYRDGKTVVFDPVLGDEHWFDPSTHLLRPLGKDPGDVPGREKKIPRNEGDIDALFSDSAATRSEKDLARIGEVVQKTGKKTFVCAMEIPPFSDVCSRLGEECAAETMTDYPNVLEAATERSLEACLSLVRSLRDRGVHGLLIFEEHALSGTMTPEQYRRFAMPSQRALVEAVHDAGMYVILSPGPDVSAILSDVAGLEADGLLTGGGGQGSGSDIGEIRKAIGEARCLFGKVSPDALFRPGDMHGIYFETERQIRAAGKRGAFAISNGCIPIPDETPPVAIDIMIEAAHNSFYPVKAG